MASIGVFDDRAGIDCRVGSFVNIFSSIIGKCIVFHHHELDNFVDFLEQLIR